jgi:RimJ/RimL family protein N-acetyltransferase
MNLQGEEEFTDKVTRDPDLLILGIAPFGRPTDRGRGAPRIQSRDRQAGFGILIGEKAEWSRGYGTEATRLIVRYVRCADQPTLAPVLEDNQRTAGVREGGIQGRECRQAGVS